MAWATLGDMAFELLLPAVTKAELAEGFTFAEHELIGQQPRLQYAGPKLREFPLTVKLSRALGDPDDELAKLRQAAKKAQALPFIWGTGQKVGTFVITDLTTRLLVTQSDGRAIEMELDLKLKEYAGPLVKPPAPAVKKR
jgi:phage protein U